MKKKLLLAAILMVVIVVGVVVGTFRVTVNKAIRKSVEVVTPKVTGTTMNVSDIDVRLFDGKVQVQGVVMGNPEGFNTPSSFELGEILIEVDTGSILSDTIVVDRIFIDSPKITYELGLGGSNIGKILEHVNSKIGGGEKGPESKPEPVEDKPGKKIIIRDLMIKNAQVSLSSTLLKGESISPVISEIHLQNIGENEGGKTFPQVLADVINEIFGEVLTTVKSEGGTVGDSIKKGASGVLEGFKGLFKKEEEN